MKFDFDSTLARLDGTSYKLIDLGGRLTASLNEDKATAIANNLSQAGMPVSRINEILTDLARGLDKPATLADVCVWILKDLLETEESQDPQGGPTRAKRVDPDEKIRRYKVARKVVGGGVIDLDDLERALIKKLGASVLSIEMAGALDEAMDCPVADKRGKAEAAE